MSLLELAKVIEARLRSGNFPYEKNELNEKSPGPRPSRELLHPDSPGFAETVARLVGMPLDVFAREGQPLEVHVPWWPETLWFVPDVRHAEALWREGIGRERLWIASELLALLSADAWTTQALRVVMVVRREFSGTVVEVRPRLPKETP